MFAIIQTAMPLSKEHKAQTRERIVRSAGVMFRELGYARAGIDDLMAGAELTRGGFYAHFPSKEALLAEVAANDHGLIRQLRRRSMATRSRGRAETLGIMRNYLAPAHQEIVARGCTFAALTGDVARAGEEVKAGYRSAFEELAAQLLRQWKEDAGAARENAPPPERDLATAAAQAVLGATILASALAPGPAADRVLRLALRQFEQQMRALWALQSSRARPTGEPS
jgi:TetR/AcrR family transcriptional regulator, transcriptional repressor for nem operon